MSDDQHYNPGSMRIELAKNIRELVRLYDLLADEIYEHSDDHDMPGGDALHYAGPIADPSTWERRYDLADPETQDWMIENTVSADVHPLTVLAVAEDDIRAMLNQPTDLTATVARASDYILGKLDDITPDGAWLPVKAFAKQVKASIRTLENVLKAGDRADRGAPCLQCGTALVKVWGGCDEKCVPKAKDHKPEHHDRWRCPKRECPVTYVDGDELALAIKNTARMYAEWLTATDMHAEYRINVGTLQSWASRDKVRKRRDFDSGRMTYNVADALAERDKSERMGA